MLCKSVHISSQLKWGTWRWTVTGQNDVILEIPNSKKKPKEAGKTESHCRVILNFILVQSPLLVFIVGLTGRLLPQIFKIISMTRRNVSSFCTSAAVETGSKVDKDMANVQIVDFIEAIKLSKHVDRNPPSVREFKEDELRHHALAPKGYIHKPCRQSFLFWSFNNK